MSSYIEQRKKYMRAVLREHRRTGLNSYQLSNFFLKKLLRRLCYLK
jgi:hypothetical protein